MGDLIFRFMIPGPNRLGKRLRAPHSLAISQTSHLAFAAPSSSRDSPGSISCPTLSTGCPRVPSERGQVRLPESPVVPAAKELPEPTQGRASLRDCTVWQRPHLLRPQDQEPERLRLGRRPMPPPCRDRGFIQGCDPPRPPTTCPRLAGRTPATTSRCRATGIHAGPAAVDPERAGTPRHGQDCALTSARPGGRFGPFTGTRPQKETRQMAGSSSGARCPAFPAWQPPPARNAASPVIDRHGRRPAPPLGRRIRLR